MNSPKMNNKGQVTIPKAIRKYLKLHAGNKVEFHIGKNGQVFINPKNINIEDIFGMISTKQHISIQQINELTKRTRV